MKKFLRMKQSKSKKDLLVLPSDILPKKLRKLYLNWYLLMKMDIKPWITDNLFQLE